MKREIVRRFSEHTRVFISSETELPSGLAEYKLSVNPAMIHHIIKDALLVFGESATMATEAAMLGVPGIYVDDNGRYYTKELEDRYGLVYNFTASESDQKNSLGKGLELIQDDDLKRQFIVKRDKMLAEKIDLTGFLTWFVFEYPGSVKKISESQNLFRKYI